MKTVPCKHWRDENIQGGGQCAINAYRNPSVGICMKLCTSYEGPDRGAGDTVKRAIQTVRLTPKKPCKPCKQRQRKLNKLIPYSGEKENGNDLLGR